MQQLEEVMVRLPRLEVIRQPKVAVATVKVMGKVIMAFKMALGMGLVMGEVPLLRTQ